MEEQRSKVDLTIIMPALNEEANIASALRRSLKAFESHHLEGEIIVVNDGSSDATPEKVEEITAGEGKGRIRMIHHREPKGIGACFRDGLREVRGEAVAMMPGDDENDPGEILRYFGLLKEVDMIIPFVYNRRVRSRLRNLLSSLYLKIINKTFGFNFNYTNGTVIYRRSILAGSRIKSDGFFFQTENIIRAAKRGYLYAEVPYRLDVRRKGASKAVSLRSLKQVIGDYCRLVGEFYFSRGKPFRGEGLAPDSVSHLRATPRQ